MIAGWTLKLCAAPHMMPPATGQYYQQNSGGMMINSELIGIASLIYLLHGFITGTTDEHGNVKKPILEIMREEGSFKKLITIVAMLGAAGCMLKLSWDISSGIAKKMPSAWASFNSWLGRQFNKAFCSSTPLQPERLHVWEQVFDAKIKHLYDPSSAGNLMLKNLRVHDGEGKIEDTHWKYFVTEIKEVFGHIIEYVQVSIPYYEQGEQAYACGTRWIAKLTQGISTQDRADIAFMSQTIINNLKHLILICEEAEGFDTLDCSHIKRLGASTLLLMRKMRTFLQGDNGTQQATGPTLNQMLPQMQGVVNQSEY